MDWRHNTIWIDQLPKSEALVADLGGGGTALDSLVGFQYLWVRGFKSGSGSFHDFPSRGTVKCLELSLANVRSFGGVSRLGPLKRLELHYCLKLESDEGLTEIADSLEWLHINQSKKFRIGDGLLGLERLKVLCLNNCAAVPNLQFLERFPALLDFRFVGTNVLDGDLSPLLRHPTLCSVGFLDRRHYSAKAEDIQRHFEERRAKSVIYVQKGPWRTFRHKDIEV